MKNMKKISDCCVALFILCCGIVIKAGAQAPVINSVTPNSTSLASYGKLELTVNLTAGYTNPFDYNDIAVQCVFTSPSSKIDTIDGFFIQDYTLDTSNGNITATGNGEFKIRFTPVETGTWQYQVICTNASGIGQSTVSNFQCTSSAVPGFIHKNSTNYLNFDNGSQYIPIGEDMGWQDNNPYSDYTNWLGKLSSNGGNYIRVWMADWSFALEWQNGSNGFLGLKNYKQSNAYYLDWLLDKCAQSGVYMLLCLDYHGQVSTTTNPEWANNPYNSAIGGPCANTWDFFTNTTAKADIKNRFRYIVARYGYTTSLMSWELFNEVDWTDNFSTYKGNVTAWHNEMAAYLKSKDIYNHLVTTSYGNDYNDPNTWDLADIDFTQTHNYVSAPNLENILAEDNQTYVSSYNKPTLNGEFGLGTTNSSLAITDPNGVYIHNCIWGSSFSGAMGSAMSWWWDNYIDPQNLYYHFKPLAAFTSKLALKNDDYKKVTASTTGGGAADLTISPSAGWAAPTSSTFTIDAAGTITPGVAQLGSFLYGNQYNTQYRNPPTFNINYPDAGQFKVVVAGIATSPQLQVYIDGVLSLSTNVAANTTYSVNVAAGTHAIKVDNLGTDWINVSNYVFTNAGAPVSMYVLRAAAKNRAAGWVLNNKYNWQYLLNNSGKAPTAVTGASITIPGIAKGDYKITFFNCLTGAYTNGSDVLVTDSNLTVLLPDIAWDVAFTATNSSLLPVSISKFYGENINAQDDLYIDIASSLNTKSIVIERGGNAIDFTALGPLDISKGIVGNHEYTDSSPLKGDNFYRLKVIDNDGKYTYSAVILLKNSAAHVALYPNPVKDDLGINISGLATDDYAVLLTDIRGRKLYTAQFHITDAGTSLSIPMAKYATGVYLVKIINSKNQPVAEQKVVK